MDKITYEEIDEKTIPAFEFYKERRAGLLKNPAYYGKHLVIKDRAIVGAFDDEDDAFRYMESKGVQRGTYIVQLVHEEDGSKVSLGLGPWTVKRID